MLNELEQRIYNEHLKSYRTAAGKPYKFRKDFSEIDPSIELHVKRVARLLHKFPHISLVDYFQAPYTVYDSGDRFDLKYYTSPRAMKAYTLYMQQEVNTDPDAPHVLQRISNALQHLSDFCKSHKITTDVYPSHITNSMPTFLLHLKERKITPHILVELHNTLPILRQQDPEIIRFMFGESFYNNINVYKNKYLASKTCKALVRAGVQKINKIIQNLENQNK